MTFTELRHKYNQFSFVWAISNILSKGTETCSQFSDEEIEKSYQEEIEFQKGKCLIYTPEILRDMLIISRELAKMDMTYLLNEIVKADLFHAYSIPYERMSEIASKCIDSFIYNDEEQAKDWLQYEAELSEEELDYFNVNIEEEE